MAKAQKAPTLWDWNPESEVIRYDSIKSAVTDFVEERRLSGDEIPEAMTVYGYAPMDLPNAEIMARDVLDYLIECLDEDYADWRGNGTEATEEMKAAALVFVKAVYSEYSVWNHERVCSEVVKVADYL